MTDGQDFLKIATDLIEKRQVPAPLREQALASTVVGLHLMEMYGKVPQLEDMDPNGFGLAPVDANGTRVTILARPSSSFYLRAGQVKSDAVVFARYDSKVNKVEILGWLPSTAIESLPLKEFVNGSSFEATPSLMRDLPEQFDFSPKCDMVVCTKPAIWLSGVGGWDCISCGEVRFSGESRDRIALL